MTPPVSPDPMTCSARFERVLETVSLSQDIFDLGLRTSLDSSRESEIVARIKDVRAGLRARLEAQGLTGLVASFEPGAYISRRLLPRTCCSERRSAKRFPARELASNAYFRSVLAKHGLDEALYRMGLEIARNVVELFRDLPPDHPFFQQLTFMTSEEIPDYQALLQKLQDKPFAEVAEIDRNRIIGLSFHYIEPRHRFGLLNDDLMKRIVGARAKLLRRFAR